MAADPRRAATLLSLPSWLAERSLPARVGGDADAMALAIALAHENVVRGGGPFGAVLRVDGSGELAAVGVNLVNALASPALHAEIVALLSAGRAGWSAGEATLFSTCEPCVMCLGALHWSGVSRIVSAAQREDAEAIGFCEGAGVAELRAEMIGRGVKIEAGFARSEAVAVLRRYVDLGGPIYGPKPQP